MLNTRSHLGGYGLAAAGELFSLALGPHPLRLDLRFGEDLDLFAASSRRPGSLGRDRFDLRRALLDSGPFATRDALPLGDSVSGQGALERRLGKRLTAHRPFNEFDAVLWTEGQRHPAALVRVKQVADVHMQVAAVVDALLRPAPTVVHHDRFERADLDADVAAHAARVVDPELIHDLAPVARAFRLLRVVNHHRRHAIDRAVAHTDVAACTHRLFVVEVPQEHGEAALAHGQRVLVVRVLHGHWLA